MGIVLLVSFIVPEADFQQSWYKHTVVLEEFMINYIFTVFRKSGCPVRNVWVDPCKRLEFTIALVSKIWCAFLDLCVCRWSSRKNLLSIDGNFLYL